MDYSMRFWTCACDNCFKKLLFCIGFFFAIFAMSLDQQASFSVLSVQILLFLHCSALLTVDTPLLRRHLQLLLSDNNEPFSQEMFWQYFMLSSHLALLSQPLVKLHKNEPCSFTHLPFFIEPSYLYTSSIQSGPMNLFFLQ